MEESDKKNPGELNIHEKTCTFCLMRKQGYKKNWTSQKTDVSRTALLIYN